MEPLTIRDMDDIRRPHFEEWLAAERSVDALLDTFSRRSWRETARASWRLDGPDLTAVRRGIAREIRRRGGCVVATMCRDRDIVYRAKGEGFQCELPT